MVLKPHVLLLETGVHPVRMSRLSIYYPNHSQCKHHFNLQGNMFSSVVICFAIADLISFFSRHLININISSWSLLRALLVCTGCSMVPGMRLKSETPELPLVLERIRFMMSAITVVDSINGFNILFSGMNGLSWWCSVFRE